MASEATENATAIEWRVGWSASTNITFRGYSDWMPWEDDEPVSVDEVETAITHGDREGSEAFEMVMQASGFEWWTEVREVDAQTGTSS